MTRLTKQDICRGMEAGISEWTMHDRVYHQGKSVDEAIAMGPSNRRKPAQISTYRAAKENGLSRQTLKYWVAKLERDGYSHNGAVRKAVEIVKQRLENRRAKAAE